ncbi:MAG: acyl-CoA thioesterase [Labilithrix sp.]|nr:acyl-CoA thioesterase [Labilithrix sp.]
MSAVSASSPRPFSTHSIAVDVDDADIDELGHVSNIAYVRWIQEVAIAHSTAVGLDFEAYRKLGGVFFIRRHEIDYLRPVLRTDRLEVRTWIDSATAVKCVRATEMHNQNGAIVARARTTWGYVEIARGRPVRIPDVVRTAFELKGAAEEPAAPGGSVAADAASAGGRAPDAPG